MLILGVKEDVSQHFVALRDCDLVSEQQLLELYPKDKAHSWPSVGVDGKDVYMNHCVTFSLNILRTFLLLCSVLTVNGQKKVFCCWH